MKALRIVLAAVFVAALSLSAVGCSDGDVAARVNGEVISKSDLDAQVEALKQQYPDMFEGADGEGRLLEFQQRLLDNMINNVLIRQAAEERGIEVSDADVTAELEKLKAGFQSDEQFEQALAQANMDVAALEDQVREQLMTEQLLDSLTEEFDITDAEITEYYEANAAQFQEQAATHAAHILFDPEEKALAEEILAEVKAGGDFAALAKEHSKDPGSAANGGDLGWPTTPYVPEFQAAADALDAGEISDLVETTFGWHIIKVIEKREARDKPLEEVKDQIVQILEQQYNADVYQQFLNEQRDAAEIEILIPELATPAVSQEGTEGTESEESDSGE